MTGTLPGLRADQVIAGGACKTIPAYDGLNLGQPVFEARARVTWTTATQQLTNFDKLIPFNATIIGIAEGSVTNPTATNCTLKIGTATDDDAYATISYSTNLATPPDAGGYRWHTTTATDVASLSISAGAVLRFTVPIAAAAVGEIDLLVLYVPRA